MKKLIAIVIGMFITTTTLYAQKLVIGDKRPDLREVEWLTAAPKQGTPQYIDFFQSSNKICSEGVEKLAKLKEKNPNVTFILLTREKGEAIDKIIETYGSTFLIGYDGTGKAYKEFGVKFLPFSMVFNSKGRLHWQGNINQLTSSSLRGL